MTQVRFVSYSLLALVALFSLSALSQVQTFTVGMRDACDPDSFNATVGPGTCMPGAHGTTKFNLFIAELQQDHIAGAWRFNPLLNTTPGTFSLATVNLKSGQQLSLQNFGGEVHTFTRVARYKGGVVPVLNQLSQNLETAPECLQPETATNIIVEAGTTETGPTAGSEQLPVGRTHWECCIHPWMRMDVVVHENF
jgi:hypothetical protein